MPAKGKAAARGGPSRPAAAAQEEENPLQQATGGQREGPTQTYVGPRLDQQGGVHQPAPVCNHAPRV